MKRFNLSDYILSIMILIIINFMLPRAMPGNPLDALYGEEVMISLTPELKHALEKQFSMDKPLSHQFAQYLLSLARGDLGYSYYYKTSVSSVIKKSLPWTLLLTGLALFITSVIGFIVGLDSGFKRGSTRDKGLLTGFMFLSGFPDYFIGSIFLIVFGVVLGIAPLGGAYTPFSQKDFFQTIIDVARHIMLPLSALIITRLSAMYLLTRNTVISILGEPYIATARAKGCSEQAIQYKHAGKSSLLPAVTSMGLQACRIVTGALFVEIIFSYPGIGTIMYTAFSARDYPLIQGILLVITLVVLCINAVVDLIYMKINPGISYAY